MHPLCALEETCLTFPQPRHDTYTNLKSQNCQFLTPLLQYLIKICLSTNILINSTSCPPQPKPATPAAEPRADDPLLLGVHHRSANHLLDLHQEGQCYHHHPHQRHLHPIKKHFPKCQQRERWRTGWNEPKDDRFPSWKDDRSQRAGHSPCISMAW